MGQGRGGWELGAQMGRCIVLPSHRLPGPTGLPLCSEMLQHPRGPPEALGCSSPPNWMPRTLSEKSLCWEKKSWELSKSGRVGVQGERAVLCPSLRSHWGCRGPWVGDTSQGVRVTVATQWRPREAAQDRRWLRCPRSSVGCCSAPVDVKCPPGSWRAAGVPQESKPSPGTPMGPTHRTVAGGSGEFICELAPTALLSTPMGLPGPVLCWVLVSPGEAKPIVSPRLCKATRGVEAGQGVHAHAWEIRSSACSSSPGGSGRFGTLSPVSCCGMMASSHPRAPC